jgi:hypothetical protein
LHLHPGLFVWDMAFAAGPPCRGLVKETRQPLYVLWPAPGTWSSWASGARNARLSGKTGLPDGFSYGVRRGGFGGQITCQFGDPCTAWGTPRLSTSGVTQCPEKPVSRRLHQTPPTPVFASKNADFMYTGFNDQFQDKEGRQSCHAASAHAFAKWGRVPPWSPLGTCGARRISPTPPRCRQFSRGRRSCDHDKAHCIRMNKCYRISQRLLAMTDTIWWSREECSRKQG